MTTFPPLRPLVPYRVPEDVARAELGALDRGRARALEWMKQRGIDRPGFKEHRENAVKD